MDQERIDVNPADERDTTSAPPATKPLANVTSQRPRTKRSSKAAARRKREDLPETRTITGREETLSELEHQGFSLDEANRLIDISERLANSKEAREAEVTLRRLRFTRWLVERGVLNEFSA